MCDWKRTVEMKFQGLWCDTVFSMDAAKESPVKESWLLNEALDRRTVAQRGAINLLVAWAKQSGLAKTKEDGRTVKGWASRAYIGLGWASVHHVF